MRTGILTMLLLAPTLVRAQSIAYDDEPTFLHPIVTLGLILGAAGLALAGHRYWKWRAKSRILFSIANLKAEIKSLAQSCGSRITLVFIESVRYKVYAPAEEVRAFTYRLNQCMAMLKLVETEAESFVFDFDVPTTLDETRAIHEHLHGLCEELRAINPDDCLREFSVHPSVHA